MKRRCAALTLAILLTLALTLPSTPLLGAAADLDESGAVPLRSAGALAFGPDGILFVADSLGGAVFAIDTGDDRARYGQGPLAVEGIDQQIAALLGATADDIRIEDMVVNPLSKKAYFSVMRGQGPDALPALVRVAPKGEPELVELGEVRFGRAAFDNLPAEDAEDRRGRSLRLQAITDLDFSGDRLLVTGLSNEEFASKLRVLSFPFTDAGPGTSVEIFHGAHGRWETNAPVRTLTTYEIDSEPHVLAAYTCTPLVKFPLEELASAAKVTGSTVAELGNRNRPLDMVVYQRSGKDYLLMANSSRGVMKVDLAGVADVEAITEKIEETAGLPYETMTEWDGTRHLDKYGDEHAVLLIERDGRLDLETVRLP